MSEEWEKYYTKEQLTNLQRIELELLKTFIDVCTKLDLVYFVYGGTLLGVEKYEGFIPWDDDVDVALPRESYNKLIQYGYTVLPNEYYLQTPYNCPESPYPYSKLRRKGTKYVEYPNRNVKIDTGIYIDIYPVDRIPDDERLRKKQYRRVWLWTLIYSCRQTPLYDRSVPGFWGPFKRAFKYIVCKSLRAIPQEYCIRKIDKYKESYNNIQTKRFGALDSPNYNNIYEQLFPLEKGFFEGLPVYLPGNYRSHLRMRYGDYSSLPPEDQRCGHIPYILDLGDC